MSSKEPISPCPFCGSAAATVGTNNGFWCHCVACHATGASERREEDAVRSWNRRFSPTVEKVVSKELSWSVEETVGVPSFSAPSLLGSYHIFKRGGVWKWFCQDSLDWGQAATMAEAKAAVQANLNSRIAAELELQDGECHV